MEDAHTNNSMIDFFRLLNRERIVLTAITPGAQKVVRTEQFTDIEKAVAWAKEHNDSGFNLYFTINITRDLTEKITSGHRASAEDIEGVWAFKLDIDTVRPKDTSSTDIEKQEMMKQVLGPVYQFFQINLGRPMVIDSGNGAQVFVRLDPVALPTKEFQHACDALMDFLDVKFSIKDVAVVDTSVKDLPRVFALCDTIKRKGENLPDRPWRVVSIVDEGEKTSLVQFTKFIDEISGLWGDRTLRRWVERLPKFQNFHNGKLAFVGYMKKHAGLDEETAQKITDLYTWLRGEPNWDMTVEKADNRRMVLDTFEKDDENISIEHLSLEDKKALDDVFLEDKRQQIREQLKAAEFRTVKQKETPPMVVLDEKGQKSLERARIAERHHLTDLGNAGRMLQMFGTNLRFCALWNKWLVWDGTRWKIDEMRLIDNFAFRVAKSIYDEADDRGLAMGITTTEIKEIVLWAKNSESRARTEAMIKQAAALMAVHPKTLDADPWKLNLLNGTLDLKTGKLLPHDQPEMITSLAPVVYDPDATCPLFTKFVERVLPDEAVREHLQLWLGYALTGDMSEKAFKIDWGPTKDNGKTTMYLVVKAMLGDYAAMMRFDMLTERDRSNDPKNELAGLIGKRLILATEASSNARKKLDTSTIKAITGRDPIRCRFLYGEWFEYQPTYKIWLMGNEKPTIDDDGDATWDRVHLVYWKVRIPREEQDKHLADKIIATELSGVLNWAIEGCLKWQRAGALPVVKEIEEAVAEYRDEQDIIGQFLSECTEPNVLGTVPYTTIYNEYTAWCQRRGKFPYGDRKFSAKMIGRGFVKKHTNIGALWVGLKLR